MDCRMALLSRSASIDAEDPYIFRQLYHLHHRLGQPVAGFQWLYQLAAIFPADIALLKELDEAAAAISYKHNDQLYSDLIERFLTCEDYEWEGQEIYLERASEIHELGPLASVPLLEAVEQRDFLACSRALEIFAETGNPLPIAAVMKRLKSDRDWKIQSHVLNNLQRYCRDQLEDYIDDITGFIATIEADHFHVFDAALGLLTHLDVRVSELIPVLYKWWGVLEELIEDESFDAYHGEILKALVRMLVRLGTDKEVHRLGDKLACVCVHVRRGVVEGLIERKSLDATSWILERIHDLDYYIRLEAIYALGEIGYEVSIQLSCWPQYFQEIQQSTQRYQLIEMTTALEGIVHNEYRQGMEKQVAREAYLKLRGALLSEAA
jgi:hypothetical protein